MSTVTILYTLSILVIVYFTFLAVWYTVLLVASFPEVLKKFRESKYGNISQLIDREHLIPITVVTPAFNEQDSILDMLYSGFNSDYKNVNFIVVNDGSTDHTMDVLIKEFELFEIPQTIKPKIKTCVVKKLYRSKKYPNLTVLDKEHSPYNCAADAVNAGLNACQTPIMLTIDADTILEPDALSNMMFNFLSHNHCVVVSGSLYVINGNRIENGKILEKDLPRKFVPAVQGVEYLRSFLYGRSGLNVLGGAISYPGAFTLFETEALLSVGGFDTENFAYDSEIITKIHHYMRKNKYPYTLNHSSNAFCWTDVPGTMKSYWHQRNLWHRGMWRTILKHMSMLFNPRYGVSGLLTFPSFVLFDTLGPLVEFFALTMFIIAFFIGELNYSVVFWFIVLAWGYITYITVAMIFLNLISFNKYKKMRTTFRSIWLVFAEMLGFRQYRALCCTLASVEYLINRIRGKPL